MIYGFDDDKNKVELPHTLEDKKVLILPNGYAIMWTHAEFGVIAGNAYDTCYISGLESYLDGYNWLTGQYFATVEGSVTDPALCVNAAAVFDPQDNCNKIQIGAYNPRATQFNGGKVNVLCILQKV